MALPDESPPAALVNLGQPVEIRFGFWAEGLEEFETSVRALVEAGDCSAVCEVGGGANPLLGLEEIKEAGIEHCIVDIDRRELDKAPSGYVKVLADVAAPTFSPPGTYDLVVSRTVLEHLRAPETFHANVWSMLEPEGRAAHFFPTLYAVPFVFNRLAPELLARRLLGALQEGREASGHHGKFKAYYRRCRGPTRSQIAFFRRLGFSVDEYVGYFGHDYLAKLPPIQRLEDRWARWLVRHPFAPFTSYSFVLLSKQSDRAR